MSENGEVKNIWIKKHLIKRYKGNKKDNNEVFGVTKLSLFYTKKVIFFYQSITWSVKWADSPSKNWHANKSTGYAIHIQKTY